MSALRQAVQASLCFKNGAKVVTLKVMLIGGNFVVHKFLCAYIALASKDRQLFIDVQLELFIVPTVRNDLASFLAHSDKWYRRHIYYPFIGPVGICPQVFRSPLILVK